VVVVEEEEEEEEVPFGDWNFACNENASLFLSAFPMFCPEPVFAKRSFLA
jgi:hypothetical protein